MSFPVFFFPLLVRFIHVLELGRLANAVNMLSSWIFITPLHGYITRAGELRLQGCHQHAYTARRTHTNRQKSDTRAVNPYIYSDAQLHTKWCCIVLANFSNILHIASWNIPTSCICGTLIDWRRRYGQKFWKIHNALLLRMTADQKYETVEE